MKKIDHKRLKISITNQKFVTPDFEAATPTESDYNDFL